MIITPTNEAEYDSTLRTVTQKVRNENFKYHKNTLERDKIHA